VGRTLKAHSDNSWLRTIEAVAVVLAFCCLVSFALLQLHNQSQTEYLIHYDFWRLFSALKNGLNYPYIYHNVHTYVIVSLIWYLDVLLAHGSLIFLHTYVATVTLLAFACLLVLLFRRANNASRSYMALTAFVSTAVWMSPSNSNSFAYPSVDILASTLLFLSTLAILVRTKEETGGISYGWQAAYLFVVCFGFLTLESFLVLPLFLAIDGAMRGRRKEATIQFIFVVCLLVLYVVFLRRPSENMHLDQTRAVLAVAHNFLILLSSHYGLLSLAFGTSLSAASSLSLLISSIQLGCFGIYAWHLYKQPTGTESDCFPIPIAMFAMASVALATWLRVGNEPINFPIDRYTVYSTMFSMSVLLLGVFAQCTKTGLFASITIMVINMAYLAAEGSALLFWSHNTGKAFIMARLEMPIYAQFPGNELNIGPGEPNEGRDYRANLHDFLRARQLSVFSSDGYRSLGMPFVAPDTTGGVVCSRRHDNDTPRANMDYHYISFEGVEDTGLFLVIDERNIVISFSFAGKVDPYDQTVIALLPEETSQRTILFTKFRQGKLVSAVRCQ
jgi:hypothetical protein